MCVRYDHVSSDHFPLLVSLDWSPTPVFTNTADAEIPLPNRVSWEPASPCDLARYHTSADMSLSKCKLPIDAFPCQDPNCNKIDHTTSLDKFALDITALKNADASSFPKRKCTNSHAVPGWNYIVREYHTAAREAFALWRECNRPRYGAIWDLMRKTRAKFKLSLRECRRMDAQQRADALATSLHNGGNVGFWSTLRSQNGSKPNLPGNIDGYNGTSNIASMWREHCDSLLNSVTPNKCKSSVDDIINSEVNLDPGMFVTVSEVGSAINMLPNGKSCDSDGLSAEHLKHAGPRLTIFLALLFSAMLRHGHVPPVLLKVILIPIIKKQNLNPSIRNNYRPIAISSPIIKLFESLLLTRLEKHLASPANQFGFKAHHGTYMCIFALKEIISYFKHRGSPVFACFLDASKAFDRVNHYTLFKKQIDRNVPVYLVRIIVYWFCMLTFRVRWGSTVCDYFSCSNGVPQGSILSPLLFNVYVSDLSDKLNAANAGCFIGNSAVNHLFYADDLCLICPSAKAVQKLINVCEAYSTDSDMIFCAKKTNCMYFPCNRRALNGMPPSVKLYGKYLPYVSSVTYLGFQITPDLSDDESIRKQTRHMYSKANSLIR